MPNYGGESSGGSDLGGGNYVGGGGNSDIGVSYGTQGLINTLSRFWDGLNFQTPSAASYVDVLGGVSNGARGRNMFNPFNQVAQAQAPAPPVNPILAQAQNDIGGGWGQYSAPQMNPMQYGGQSMYGSPQPFNFGDYFGGGK